MTLNSSQSDRDRRRNMILKVAHEVFLEYGFTCATMGTIAARLGVCKAVIYGCFKSKEDLFAAQVTDFCRGTAQDCFDSALSMRRTRNPSKSKFDTLWMDFQCCTERSG